MVPSKVQIYRSHFFLNFLCGVLYISSGYMMFSFTFESAIVVLTPAVITIVALIRVNRISCERFKQYNIKISHVIYPALTYVGFTMPYAILLLILFEMSFVILLLILVISYISLV